MQSVANTSTRYDRQDFQRDLEKLSDWSHKPLTARAECAVAAACGTLMFLLFVFAAGLA